MPRTDAPATVLTVSQADLRRVVALAQVGIEYMRSEALKVVGNYPLRSSCAAELTEAETALRPFREALKDQK